MAREEGRDATLRDYVRVIQRRKWVVVGFAVVLTALALAYSYTRTPMYEASARLMYESQLNVADPLSTGGYVDPSQMQVQLNSVASSIASPDLIASAKAALGPATATFTVSAAPDTQTGQTDASTVSIKAVSSDPKTAARAANAYAKAFTDGRKAKEQERVRAAEQVIQKQLDSFDSATSKQSADYLTLKQRLQDLQILEATVNGNFSIVIPATTPTEPFSPRPMRDAAIGLVAGLILGIAFVLLLDQFDTRVRTPEEAVSIFGMPGLANLRKLPTKVLERQPLFVVGSARSPAAEAVRKLRGNLEFANIDGDLGSFFITSSLQHEGKTLTVCNLAISLAASGRRVVLVDGDLRRPQIHHYLGLTNATGLSTVLTGRSELISTLHSRSVGPGISSVRVAGENEIAAAEDSRLHVLTSGPLPPNPAEMIASRSFAKLMEKLCSDFELVIVDAPALLAVGDTAAIARCVDGLVFLIDLTQARRPALIESATQLSQMPCRKLGLVTLSRTSVSRADRDHYTYYSHEETQVSARAAR